MAPSTGNLQTTINHQRTAEKNEYVPDAIYKLI